MWEYVNDENKVKEVNHEMLEVKQLKVINKVIEEDLDQILIKLDFRVLNTIINQRAWEHNNGDKTMSNLDNLDSNILERTICLLNNFQSIIK